MKIPYSHAYSPPAPILMISLAVPEEAPPIGPYPALIDTGADGTLVPSTLLEELGVPVEYVTYIRSHLGDKAHSASVYTIDIVFNASRLPNIEVVGDQWGNEVVLGRNVLNRIRLQLDGPKEIVNLLRS